MSDHDELAAARLRQATVERALRIAHLDNLEARARLCSHEELKAIYQALPITSHLDADDTAHLDDESWLRGYLVGEVRGLKAEVNSEREQRRRDSIETFWSIRRHNDRAFDRRSDNEHTEREKIAERGFKKREDDN